MSDLGAFQAAFAKSLFQQASRTPESLPLNDQEQRLFVHRNTVIKGAIDALVANFPTVGRVVGTEWMRAAAFEFARRHPPATASLLAYGAEFPGWLIGFEPARSLPYLADLARIDRLWTESHLAPDSPSLSIEEFRSLQADDLRTAIAVLHPSVRIAAFSLNIADLWQANRPQAIPAESFELREGPQHLLLTRPRHEVRARVIDQCTYTFLSACARRLPLAEAAARLGHTEMSCAIATIMDMQAIAAFSPGS